MAKKPTSAKSYQVFLSHATADKWLAKVLCEKMEEAGAKTFRDDRDIAGGDKIPEEIGEHIKQSEEMVVLLTPESVQRPWVLIEIGAALFADKRVRVVPLRCHVTVDSVPEMLKDRKSISLNEMDDYLQELRVRVGSYHGDK